MVDKRLFGKTSAGEEVYLFEMVNQKGAVVNVIGYGCTVQSIVVPDKNGNMVDVCLGYNSMEAYEKEGAYIGAVCGRVANRIRNASFSLGGVTYQLTANEGANQLHGGTSGFSLRVWDGCIEGEDVVFRRISADGEDGFPGNLDVTVRYSWSDDNRLGVHYTAVSDKDTLFNPTHHAYFNLAGEASGDVLDQEIMIAAEAYLHTDYEWIADGVIETVEGTPFDFRQEKAIGRDIHADFEQVKKSKGYDHSFILHGGPKAVAATARCRENGIQLAVYTDMPQVQLYTASGFQNRVVPGKGGQPYNMYAGFCFETQYPPDAINTPQLTPVPILKAGEQFTSTTVFAFGLSD